MGAIFHSVPWSLYAQAWGWYSAAFRSELETQDACFKGLRGDCHVCWHEVQPRNGCLVLLLLLIYKLWKVPVKSLGTTESRKKLKYCAKNVPESQVALIFR